MIKQFDSLFDMMGAFPDEQSCVDHLRAMRWGANDERAYCPQCGSSKIYHFSDGRNHKCGDCRARFSIKVGTIFEDTKIPLRKWFMAIWMLTSHKKGIASTTLAKDIKVTQKTAWFMLHRLRHAAATKSFNAPLKGTVEADETYVGGKEKNKHAKDRSGDTKGGKGKAIVFGMIERDGEVRASVVSDTKAKTIQAVVRENVAKGANLMTDEHGAYTGLGRDYHHHTVNHGIGEYVRSICIHTNTIEGVWSLLKRQIIGIHHWVSPKHLNRYVSEATWRFNRRGNGEGVRMNVLLSNATGRLRYRELIA